MNKLRIMTVTLSLAAIVLVEQSKHNTSLCLTSVKVKTTMTGKQQSFTGEWKKIDGVLFCYDKRHNLYPYRAPGAQ